MEKEKNWYDKNHGSKEIKIKQREYNHSIANEIAKKSKENIWYLIYKYCLKERQDVELIQKIASYIDWTDKKEEIWEMAKNDPSFNLINLPESIDWTDKKEEIWELINIRGFKYNFPRNIDWTDKKEEIWRNITNTSNIIDNNLPESVDWSDRIDEIYNMRLPREDWWKGLPPNLDLSTKKEDIWKSFEEQVARGNSKVTMPNNIAWSKEERQKFIEYFENNLIRQLPDIEFDDEEMHQIFGICFMQQTKMDYKDFYQIWLGDDVFDKLPSNVITSISNSELLENLNLFNYIKLVVNHSNHENSVNTVEGIKCIIDKFRMHEPVYYEKIQEILKKSNPIYSQSIYASLNFDICPWLPDNLDRITEENVQETKTVLLQIFDRLQKIGFVNHAIELEENNIKKYIGETRVVDKKESMSLNEEGEELKTQIIKLSDKVDITVMLAFYLNKLTKVNEITMYARALNGFEYISQFDADIQNKQEDELSDEVKLYKKQRNLAENKGNKIISTLKYLRGNNSNPTPRNDNFAYLKKQAENIQNGNISSYNLPMKSFTEFLNYWKDVRDENGYLQIEKDSKFYKFGQTFNQNIKNLLNEGCTLEEITNNFMYASNALDLEDKLYEVKICLLQQIIEYSKREEYRDKISVQYEEHKSFEFEEIYELWKNDDNRDKSGNFKSNFQEPNLSEKIIKKFNEEIQKLVESGIKINDIKEGIPNNLKVFEEFKLSIENFQIENIDDKTKDILYVITDKYLFPMSFHTNIKKFAEAKSLLRVVQPNIKKYSDDESINIPYILPDEKYKELIERKEEFEFDELLNQLFNSGVVTPKNIVNKRKFDKNKDEFYNLVKKMSKFIGVIDKENDFEINDENRDELLKNLNKYVDENSQNPGMKKKILMAKVSVFLVKREKNRCEENDPEYIEFQSNFESLKTLINEKPEKVTALYKLLNAKQTILSANRVVEAECQSEGKSINEEFLNLEQDTKKMVRMLIESNHTIDDLKKAGISELVLEYAKFYQNERNKRSVENNGNNITRPGSVESRSMTSTTLFSDTNQVRNEVMAEAEKGKNQEDKEGETYGE